MCYSCLHWKSKNEKAEINFLSFEVDQSMTMMIFVVPNDWHLKVVSKDQNKVEIFNYFPLKIVKIIIRLMKYWNFKSSTFFKPKFPLHQLSWVMTSVLGPVDSQGNFLTHGAL